MDMKELAHRAKTVRKIEFQKTVTKVLSKLSNPLGGKPSTGHTRRTPYHELTPTEKKQRVRRVLRERTR